MQASDGCSSSSHNNAIFCLSTTPLVCLAVHHQPSYHLSLCVGELMWSGCWSVVDHHSRCWSFRRRRPALETTVHLSSTTFTHCDWANLLAGSQLTLSVLHEHISVICWVLNHLSYSFNFNFYWKLAPKGSTISMQMQCSSRTSWITMASQI